MTNNKAQQSAEKTAEQQQVLRDLLALGKKNGRLTLKEMADALSHLELESDDIDKLYETLESMGVEVETEGVLEKALGDGDDDSFEPDTVEEVPEEELIDTSAMAETFAIDDPVRMYLKEIGKVNLLSPDEEIQLAQDMDLEQEEGSLRQRSQPVTVNRGSGWQEALVTRQDYPVYQGAVVVCQGAGSSAVRLAVTEAVAALTGLSTEKITVVQWEQ